MGSDSVKVDIPTGYDFRSYRVVIRPGSLDDVAELIDEICPAHRYALITDTRVGELYASRVLKEMRDRGSRVEAFKFPSGEWNKTRDVWGKVIDSLIAAGIGRDAAVIALGGGVVGDVAGFVAATYMRGIRLVQIPTTLLAMVDSSVGGKTGLDTPAGKNLVGAFHQPALVVVDPQVLKTLPTHQLSAGMAEVIKHGLIADAGYFARVASEIDKLFQLDVAALTATIRRSIEIKAAVVTRDERESGYRRILNFGHTVGHALEAVSGYERLHGEAVAIGLAGETAIGEAIGVTSPGVAERVREVLQRARLPVSMDGAVARDRFFEALATDKKRLGDASHYTLIADVGRVAGDDEAGWTHEVSDEVVEDVLFG